MEYALCQRCGATWDPGDRKKSKWCSDCRTRRTSKVGDCTPWQGNFAFDMVTPLNEFGEIVFPGVRLCGNADCVNPGHIVPINER